MKTACTYTVLRYVHDTATGEFVNVGVALYAPGANYVGALCRTTYDPGLYEGTPLACSEHVFAPNRLSAILLLGHS